MLEYFGCDFNTDFYHTRCHEERLGIKKALESYPTVCAVRPEDCIATERRLERERIRWMAENFSLDLFYSSLPKILAWGCGLLVLDGHHRLSAAVMVEECFILARLYPFR
jgi:hypothetical protein